MKLRKLPLLLPAPIVPVVPVTLVALVVLFGACAGPKVRSPAREEADSAELQRARRLHQEVEAIAQWLELARQPTPNGVTWLQVPDAAPTEPTDATAPTTPTAPTEPDRSLYAGAAGPVLFFLELADGERDAPSRARWLASARAGADDLLDCVDAKSAPKLESGLYTGVAGIGFTLLRAWQVTEEVRYAEGARHCVDLLHDSAQLAGSGIEWNNVTDVIAGSAGIGLFLLTMHEETGDLLALELATRAGRRLLDLSVREAVGRSCRMDPVFPRVMPNFSHGTAGIAFFLARLHETTGEAVFLAAAKEGAEHLLSIADRSGEGCRIYHHTPDGTDLYYLGWCHGPVGTARLFAELYWLTGEAKWADAVAACARAVATSGLPEQPLPGFWNNVSWCCGSAGVVEFFLELAVASGDPACLAFARRVADDLRLRGAQDEKGLRFPQAEHRVKPELIAAQTGWMQGASGIGVALLHLERFERAGAGGRGEGGGLGLPDDPFARGATRRLPWSSFANAPDDGAVAPAAVPSRR